MKDIILAKLLRKMAKDLEDGNCQADKEELNSWTDLILHRKMTIEEVCREYGFSRATLFRKVESGEFPKPHHSTDGRNYFWKDEIERKLSI